ncbi:MAG TPA: FAD-dependent oxidoreductase [Candidatus Limnocylindrales bacterium]|nr:FAD-dependent oxidoreductase [Candidatus Limnocylindrales bacterium]
MKRFDVGIIGGGIIGATAAAFLAEAGRSVLLLERGGIGAGASGRNSGVIQHPFDPLFATLFYGSLDLYRELASQDDDFAIPDSPAGLLLLSKDGSAVVEATRTIAESAPDLSPEVVDPSALATLEPALAEGLWACRLHTGYPVEPAGATHAWARRARRAGATFALGKEATVDMRNFDQVLIAAGPWTPALVPGWSDAAPIVPIWGVVVSTTLRDAPRHVLEEMGIARSGETQEREFSLVTAGGRSSLGSTFLPHEPDAPALAPELIARGAQFVPEIGRVSIDGVRACARPVSRDGRPLIGLVDGRDNLFVCAGHGPWGISTGPASALMVVRRMLGQAEVHPAFAARRFSGLTTTEFA